MGYTVAARFHDQPLDLPYLAVGRTDGQLAVYLYLAEWDGVDGDLRRRFRFARVTDRPGYAHTQAILLPCLLMPDLARRSVHKVNRDKPPGVIPVLWVDYEMSDLPGDRVDDYAAHLTTGSIGATGVGRADGHAA